MPLRSTPLRLAVLLSLLYPTFSHATLLAPANNTVIEVAPGATSQPIPRNPRLQLGRKIPQLPATTLLRWNAGNLPRGARSYLCLQRLNNFPSRGTGCNDAVHRFETGRRDRLALRHSQLASEVGRTLFWSVRTCVVSPIGRFRFTGSRDRYVCGNWRTSRALRIRAAAPPPATADLSTWNAIAPAFRSPTCTNCHRIGVAAGASPGSFSAQLQRIVSAGIPHPSSSSVSQCHLCHRANIVNERIPAHLHSELLPNLRWSAAPLHMDFRNRSARELCEMAKTTTEKAPTVSDHLRRDPLILWAIAGGSYPESANTVPPSESADPNRSDGYSARPAIPGMTVVQWRQAVRNWINAAMPCPP